MESLLGINRASFANYLYILGASRQWMALVCSGTPTPQGEEENARLAAENAQLRGQAPAQVIAAAPTPQVPSQAEIDAQRNAQIAAEKAARRQQMIQTWLTLQNMNRPQTQNLNVTVSDCTRFPALCAGR